MEMPLVGKLVSALISFLRGSLMSPTQVEVALNTLAMEHRERLDWRVSVVDLLKLLNRDSSLAARKELALEFGYTGSAKDGSAAKNTWLHRELLRRVAEGTIAIPAHS